MSDQERYIRILERENTALRNRLFRVREMLQDAYHSLCKRLGDAYGTAEPEYVPLDPEEREALRNRLEEVLSDGNT